MITGALFMLAAFQGGSVFGYTYKDQSSHDDHGLFKYYGPTAVPYILKSGYIADTHEVAAARADHLSAVAKAKSYGGHGHKGFFGSHGYASSYGHKYSYDNHGHLLYHGPTAIPHVLKNGHLADTHEVAVAKVEHLAAVAKAKANRHYYGNEYNSDYTGGIHSNYTDGYHSGYTAGYHEPLAEPVVLKSGYLADTQEVAAAKKHHLHALHNTAYSGHCTNHY